MLLEEFCLKLFLWPIISYLAYSKGVCPQFGLTSTPFPYITLAPGATLGTTTTTTTQATVPTFQPTVPTFQPTVPTFQPTLPTTLPTTTTTVPPTITTTTTQMTTTTSTTLAPTTTTIQPTLPTIPPTICPIFPVVCLPGGATPNPPCPCIDPRKYIFSQKDRRLLSSATNCFGLDQQPGICINIAGCPYLIEEFYYQMGKNPKQMTFDDFLNKSICGFGGTSNFLICCPIRGQPIIQPSAQSGRDPSVSLFHFASLGGVNTQTQGVREVESSVPSTAILPQPTAIPPQPTGIPPQPTAIFPQPTAIPPQPTAIFPQPTAIPAQPTSHKYILPRSEADQCGLNNKTQTRVVGGFQAKSGAYPWVVALGYRSDSTTNQPRFLCGGGLITARHVLTSAHCITSDLYIVRLGAHDLTMTSNGVVDEEIEKVSVHENFDRQEVKNDIALLKLKKDVSLKNIRLICIPQTEPMISQDFVGLQPFVAGWGAILFQGQASNILQDAQIPVVSLQDCQQSYQKRFPSIKLDENVLCAGNGVADACQGDSGGPLMLPQSSFDRLSFHYYLIGIVSFGYECARSGFPGIYTRVTAYISWIESQLNN